MGIHASGIFYSIVPVDVVRMKSCVNCLFDPASVLVRIMINKLNVWILLGEITCKSLLGVGPLTSKISLVVLLLSASNSHYVSLENLSS